MNLKERVITFLKKKNITTFNEINTEFKEYKVQDKYNEFVQTLSDIKDLPIFQFNFKDSLITYNKHSEKSKENKKGFDILKVKVFIDIKDENKYDKYNKFFLLIN